VLGAPGQMSDWVEEVDYAYPDYSKKIWYLGWDNGTDEKLKDPGFAGRVLRAGNFDHLTGKQQWLDGTTPAAIPDSMYLSGKPAFFGANPWPWVNPVTGATTTLPAKARLDAISTIVGRRPGPA